MAGNLMMTLAGSIMPRRYRPGDYLHRLARQQTGMVVIRGPFAGLVFPQEADRDGLVPKLLGTYERELAAVVEEIVHLGFERIINIGAAEGYYAVGLARRIPGAAGYAFEADEDVRSLLGRTAAANGVADRIAIQGRCDPDDLQSCLAPGARNLVVCDVEGYESVLLDPALIPGLARAHILVELHELRHPGITDLLRGRFEGSHRLQLIREEPRSAEEYPFRTLYTRLLPDRFLLNMISEWRSEPQIWFWMRPRGEPERPAAGPGPPQGGNDQAGGTRDHRQGG
jgi:hypothetical protein